jgi:hypothetical protein
MEILPNLLFIEFYVYNEGARQRMYFFLGKKREQGETLP